MAIKPGYGYTHIAWEDMDLDSHPDAIAIRAKSTGSELVWLQQPPRNTAWPDHIIDEEVGGKIVIYFYSKHVIYTVYTVSYLRLCIIYTVRLTKFINTDYATTKFGHSVFFS